MSKFERDFKVAEEISDYTEQYLYNNIANSFKREEGKFKQKQGIDFTVEMNNERMYIDEKAAVYYVNKNLSTFAFELSYLNREENINTGWFLDDTLKTTHYHLMWLKTKNKDISPFEIKKEDISEIESMIVEKHTLRKHLEELGYDKNKLKNINKELRKTKDSRRNLNNNNIYLVHTKGLSEGPINLVIKKTELSKIALLHMKISDKGVFKVGDSQQLEKPISMVVEEKNFGIPAENFVFRKLQSYFANRDAICERNLPLFEIGSSLTREIDILIADKSSGLTIVEVKAFTINQIKSIKGANWYLHNYFGRQYINPYRQAKKQLDLISDKIEDNPLLFRRFEKRVVIALPNISELEWKQKGFDVQSSDYPILFKEDFEDEKNLRKLERFYLRRLYEPLSSKEWSLLRSYFDSEIYAEIVDESLYSLTYLIPDNASFQKIKSQVKKDLRKGIRVTLLCYFEFTDQLWKKKVKEFMKAFQLAIHESTNNVSQTDIIILKDGNFFSEKFGTDFTQIIKRDFSDFNIDQYNIIHAPLDEQMMVTAGAGTGKTYVMIDRIMFLLTKKVNIKDIIMITFTNEATNEIKERFQTKLINIAKLTGIYKYNELAEQVNSMQISTIHSYFKDTIKKLSHEFGYGLNFGQRGFKKVKEDIIKELIDNFLQSKNITKNTFGMRDYTLVNTLTDMWEEMEKKSLSEMDITNHINWGQISDQSKTILSELLEYVFGNCEMELNKIKQKENAIETNDLIRKTKEISVSVDRLKQLTKNKYLFMDEFQDSDNAQIQFIANLVNHLGYRIFIVGDEKQSIYRFRGADNKAFDLVEEKINGTFQHYNLTKNYRSRHDILDKLHENVFLKWEEQGWLTYKKRLEAVYKNKDKSFNPIRFLAYKDEKKHLKELTIQEIRHAQDIIKKDTESQNAKIALIVRTNKEVQSVAEWCREEGISVNESMDGTFFKSRAVKDFKTLITGLLYPNKALHVVNTLKSPYFGYEIPNRLLVEFEGDDEETLKFIHSKIGNHFLKYVNQLRNTPVMTIIQKIIHENNLYFHVENQNKENSVQKQIDLNQYRKNLHHLLDLIHKQFDIVNTSLHSINEWLSIHMATNREEDEPMLDTKDSTVNVLTVHKAKGLQYHTVILPKTSHPFEAKFTNFHVADSQNEKTQKWEVGYRIYANNESYYNNYFYELNEINKEENFKEETRLLYVALTRVIDNLVVLLPDKTKENTWAHIFEYANIEVTKDESNC